MTLERISRVMETFHGSFVYAVIDKATGERRAFCSGCDLISKSAYKSDAGAILAAAAHADASMNFNH
ncbi:hypothetical protein [Streptomyces sp. NPDC001404]|uniref:hypothetical protein n=1 Tax=Streptomyces sp. NPDC001404 TaxID=3364571 RepID=UPI0036A4421C